MLLIVGNVLAGLGLGSILNYFDDFFGSDKDNNSPSIIAIIATIGITILAGFVIWKKVLK